MPDTALLVTDIQNDFLEGGALPIAGGTEVIPIVNQLMDRFELVLATQDWHPLDHVSFAASHPGRQVGDVIEVDGIQQRLWPIHCVENSAGAHFSSRLDHSNIRRVFHKGVDRRVDSYSSFADLRNLRSTGLEEFLREHGVRRLFICGLATDYCIRYSALDAVQRGFETYVVLDACRGIEANPGDIDASVREMTNAGVRVVDSSDVLKQTPAYRQAG